mmetsp:Transcript_28934/g.67280  ORF Transcript_28934/g.67280 Transcript_28934/m.67280 type:complete len:484 (+) Transcript_28934:29-1480(+)
MASRRPMRPVDQMAARRRVADEREADIARLEFNTNAVLRASWENKTDEKLLAKRKQARIGQLRAAQQDSLVERRRQLAALLNGEMAQWQEAISASTESAVDRKNALRERAMKLRDAREAERREFVDKCYSQQWRDSCDDARTLDSKALLTLVSTTRQEQLVGKADREVVAQVQERKYLGEWRERINEVERRENAKDEARRKMDSEVKDILDVQVEEHLKRKAQLRSRQDAEAKEELELWQSRKDTEEAEVLEKLKSAYSRGREVKQFNAAREHLTKDREEKEKGEDLMLLQYALDKEKADEEFELRKKQEEKDATKQYQEYLRAQMVKEAEDTAFEDELRQKAEEEIWERLEEEQRKQRDARSYLQAEVDRGRQQQIKAKFQTSNLDLEEDLVVMSRFREQQKELDRIEAEKEEARRQARLDNVMGIRGQAALKEKARMREEQEKFLSNKLMLKTEQAHMEKLATQAGKARTFYPIKQTQWYT